VICSMVRGGHSLFPSVATRLLEPRSTELEIRRRERIRCRPSYPTTLLDKSTPPQSLGGVPLDSFSKFRVNSSGTVSVRSSSCKVSQQPNPSAR